jgi:large subunit ribosomal protein L4
MQLDVVNSQNEKIGAVDVRDDVFGGRVNGDLIWTSVVHANASKRSGTHQTKNRANVSGSGKKPWKQKGTGRARQGSTRAPHWVGGGTVFGPIPRSYAQYVPRQVRALARKSALNARARENAIYVIDRFDYDAPKTARLRALVERLGVADNKVLILTDGSKPNVFLSGRNLPAVHVMPYGDVSTYHLLWSDVVLIESSAIGQDMAPMAEQAWDAGRGTLDAAAKRPAVKKAAKKKEAAPKKPAAKKAAKKSGKGGARKAAKKSAPRSAPRGARKKRK